MTIKDTLFLVLVMTLMATSLYGLQEVAIEGSTHQFLRVTLEGLR